MAKLSADLQELTVGEDPLTLGQVLTTAGDRAFGLLFVLLSLPSALPIPAPGYSTPFGVVLLILALQWLVGRPTPWLPLAVRDRPIARPALAEVLQKALPWLHRLEKVTQPRLAAVCRSGRTVVALMVALMAAAMILPIPGTNTVPALGILVTGFGLLEDDGAIVLAGFGLSLAFLGALVLVVTGLVSLVRL
ncbi:MAG: exopolysaccharide biosynthesis protein [Pseudanabaenaceae cyanobacterium]